MSPKLLNGHPASERRDLLRRYLLTCVRDNVLSLTDITSAPDKLMRTITADLKALVTEFAANAKAVARESVGSFIRSAGGALAEIAQDVVAGRRK